MSFYNEKDAVAPTPYMLAFDSKPGNIYTGETETTDAGSVVPKFAKIAIEFRNVCPWNPDIDLLSDECVKCESCLRHGTDKRYPPYAVVCKKQIDNIPVSISLKKRAENIINQRISQEAPKALERYRHMIKERKAMIDKNAQ